MIWVMYVNNATALYVSLFRFVVPCVEQKVDLRYLNQTSFWVEVELL